MQQQTISPAPTPKPVAIEIDGEPLGIVVQSTEGYRFLAVRYSAFALDGRTFDSVEAARVAIGAVIHADAQG